MLSSDDFAGLGLELGTDLATPGAVFESLMRPSCFLDRRDVPPGLVVAWTVAMMQRIEDAQFRFPRGTQHIQHMRNAAIRFCNSLQPMPHFAALGNEVVIRIDHQKRGDVFVICHFSMLPPRRPAPGLRWSSAFPVTVYATERVPLKLTCIQSSAPRSGVYVACPMPTASFSGVALASIAGHVCGSSMRRCAWVS